MVIGWKVGEGGVQQTTTKGEFYSIKYSPRKPKSKDKKEESVVHKYRRANTETQILARLGNVVRVVD